MSDNKTVEIFKVSRISTKHGDWEYDDSGGTYRHGTESYDLTGFYATASAAQIVCDEHNRRIYSEVVHDNDGPFEEIEDDNGLPLFVLWESRIALPWPIFCDWLKDRGIPRPLIDTEGEEEMSADDVQAILSDRGPTLYEMQEWWNETIQMGNSEHRDDWLKQLGEVIPGPKLYVVQTEQLSQARVDAVVNDLKVFRDVQGAVGRVSVTEAFVASALNLARYVRSGKYPEEDAEDIAFDVQLVRNEKPEVI